VKTYAAELSEAAVGAGDEGELRVVEEAAQAG
jgi:hypothetical protein